LPTDTTHARSVREPLSTCHAVTLV
jgi:hypothetical protein